MKSIIIFALLALAANSFTLNFTAASLGEATTLGLTAEQIQTDGMPCINALSNDLARFVALVETENVFTILTGISAWFTQFQTDLVFTCKPYFTDVETILLSKVDLSQPLPLTLRANFIKYAPQIIQQAAALINNVIQEQDYQAGVNDATIGMILYGLTTPNTLPVPAFNNSDYVPFNQEEFVAQYFEAFFAGIGFNETFNASEVSQCLTQIEATFTNLGFLINNFSTYTFTEKVSGISGIFTNAASMVEGCGYGAELYVSFAGPVFQAFTASPIDFILQVANNVASNAPEILQSIQQERVYILEGQYALAGETKARRVETVFGFVNL